MANGGNCHRLRICTPRSIWHICPYMHPLSIYLHIVPHPTCTDTYKYLREHFHGWGAKTVGKRAHPSGAAYGTTTADFRKGKMYSHFGMDGADLTVLVQIWADRSELIRCNRTRRAITSRQCRKGKGKGRGRPKKKRVHVKWVFWIQMTVASTPHSPQSS
jgi:hypothetical protein